MKKNLIRTDGVKGRMTASGNIYESARMAAGYAFSRPPVHPRVLQRVAEQLHITGQLGRALDLGCGAGRSTAALAPLALVAVGLEPVRTMLAHRHAVAPRAVFAIGQAEVLPFQSRAFDLITAAGSLNYVNLARFLPDAARVLAPAGVLVIYDFSVGRRFRGDGALDEWFAAFEHRYPFPPDYDLDVRALDYERAGLRLSAYHEFEIALPLDAPLYLQYMLSETNVESALARGVPEEEIRDGCRGPIEALFSDGPRDVLFSGYVAYVIRVNVAYSTWYGTSVTTTPGL
jgi:SAM-dependent methyltransferase